MVVGLRESKTMANFAVEHQKKYMMSVVTATLLIAIVATLLLVHYDGPAAE